MALRQRNRGSSPHDLDGRVAIVTGAGRGIGRAVAQNLAESGAVVVIADLSPEGAATAEEIGADFVQGDLVQGDACRAVVAETVERHGGVHILVNNAGFQHIAPIAEFPEDTWNRMIALMLTAPFLLTQHCWPSMVEAGWGRIVNIASIHALVASPFKAAYVSAKHGLVGLTRTAALEGGPHGITVNAICPAYVRTALVEDQIADQAATLGIPEERVIDDIMLEPAAIKHLITPEEVAAFAGYLCSDAARSITGSAATLDLGWTAR